MKNVRARAAKVLGWTELEVASFSLPTIREIVRERSPKLAADITEAIRAGTVGLGKKRRV